MKPYVQVTMSMKRAMMQLRAEGVSYAKIAEQFGCAPDTVRYHTNERYYAQNRAGNNRRHRERSAEIRRRRENELRQGCTA